jgi:short-subunit dehydrogenase
LLARGRGGVILTGSIEGEAPFLYSAAYAGSKAFLHNFGLSLYGELKPAGVDLLVLAPGATATDALTRQGLTLQDVPGVMAPEEVSRQALAALGRKPMHIAGASNRMMVFLFRLLPRPWVIAITAKGTRDFMKKRRLQPGPSPKSTGG